MKGFGEFQGDTTVPDPSFLTSWTTTGIFTPKKGLVRGDERRAPPPCAVTGTVLYCNQRLSDLTHRLASSPNYSAVTKAAIGSHCGCGSGVTDRLKDSRIASQTQTTAGSSRFRLETVKIVKS